MLTDSSFRGDVRYSELVSANQATRTPSCQTHVGWGASVDRGSQRPSIIRIDGP